MYDQKSMIELKYRFLKTDQSIMIENQFLISITSYLPRRKYFELEIVPRKSNQKLFYIFYSRLNLSEIELTYFSQTSLKFLRYYFPQSFFK